MHIMDQNFVFTEKAHVPLFMQRLNLEVGAGPLLLLPCFLGGFLNLMQ